MRKSAVLLIPIARAAPRLRSIDAPFPNGPRSLMRTITDLLLRGLVTHTRVPKGASGAPPSFHSD
jgi:hypothetical protein